MISADFLCYQKRLRGRAAGEGGVSSRTIHSYGCHHIRGATDSATATCARTTSSYTTPGSFPPQLSATRHDSPQEGSQSPPHSPPARPTWPDRPFRTAVPIRGQTSLIPSGLSQKRDCSTKRVEASLPKRRRAYLSRVDRPLTVVELVEQSSGLV